MSNNLWNDNLIQFARLLSEINAVVDIPVSSLKALCESTDMELSEIEELFDRAETVYEASKDRLMVNDAPLLLGHFEDTPANREVVMHCSLDLIDEELPENFFELDWHDQEGILENLSTDPGRGGEEIRNDLANRSQVAIGLLVLAGKAEGRIVGNSQAPSSAPSMS